MRQKKMGFTELARRSGLHKSLISHMLAGRRTVSDAQANKLATLTGTKREWWMNLPRHREDIEDVVRQVGKVRQPESVYAKNSRENRKMRAALEIIDCWEEA